MKKIILTQDFEYGAEVYPNTQKEIMLGGAPLKVIVQETEDEIQICIDILGWNAEKQARAIYASGDKKKK